jgi:hypothetical protein
MLLGLSFGQLATIRHLVPFVHQMRVELVILPYDPLYFLNVRYLQITANFRTSQNLEIRYFFSQRSYCEDKRERESKFNLWLNDDKFLTYPYEDYMISN